MSATHALPSRFRALSLSRIPLPLGEAMVLLVVVMIVMLGG